MQNFTLRFKGRVFYLLTLALLFGSLPSIYGQCPTVSDSNQEYCGLDTVSDLQATDPDTSDGNTIRWYDSQTDTTAIPSNETLENGKTYYAGYQNGSCVNQRAEVTVAISTPGAPKLAQGEDEFFTPCEISGSHTVADLKAGIEFQDQSGYTLEYFDNQFNESTPLADDFQLVEGNSYFAGFVDNNDSNCQSNRTPIKYDPVEAPAPAADDQQTVCEGTTVSELEAEGTNRWYRTATSQPPLSDDFVVENGKTYYATQIIPSDGPPCESEERTAVTVTVLDPDPGTDNSETLCENDADSNFTDTTALRNYFTNLLGAGDTDGTFNPTLSDLKAAYDDGITSPSEDFTTVYTVTKTGSGETCEESATATLTVNKAETPVTGEIEDQTYCTNAGVQNLYELLEDSANPNGVFSSPTADVADGNFDPEAEGPGSYDITYTVGPENACVDGTAEENFVIQVDQAPNAGPGGDYTFCQEEILILASNPTLLLQELGNPDLTGTFDPDPTAFFLSAQGSGPFPATFTTEYTVDNGNCTDNATYSITITADEEANAGDDDEVILCTTDSERTLESFLSSDAMEGGEFSSDDFDVSSGVFNPGTEGVGSYTLVYKVDGSETCVVNEDEATIEITVEEAPDAGNDNSTVLCTEELQDNPFDNEDDLKALYLSLLDSGVATDGSFDPSMQEIINDYNSNQTGEFTTTYTIGENCEDSVELTVEVKDTIEADLNEVEDPAPFCENAGTQNLYDFIGDNPDFGRFPDYDNGTFNPGALGAGSYDITYTLDEESPCVTGSDSITFTITVEESAYAGEDKSITVCTNDNERNLFLTLSPSVDQTGTFSIDGNELQDGIFNPADYSVGTYEAIYFVESQNDCGSDSSALTITLNQGPNAGEDLQLEICQNAADFNLYSLLADDISKDGTFFNFDGEVIASGSINPSNYDPSVYSLEYLLLNDNCADTAMLTLTVRDASNAGLDMELAFCMNEGEKNLFDFLSVDADTNGEFTLDGDVIAEGKMDPMNFDAGIYTVVYTVPAENDCGEDVSEFEITIKETRDAPAVSDLNFCAIQSPMGIDLTADGTMLTFYSDADLTMMVEDDEDLTTATYYVTQRADEDSCESDAASFEVFVGDAPTPTIDNANQTFCEYDDATIGDLSAKLNETSNITWYTTADGDTSLTTVTPLENGTTYYASLYDVNTDCDSSQRLAVSVTIENCPLLFPEGISPNGDGLNDTFDIKNIEREYPNYNITIHNRWGDVVYKGNASTPKWDGFSNESGSFGDDVSTTGVYFYILDFNDGRTPPRRGKIYLSR